MVWGFFSSTYSRAVKGLGFFSLSLVEVHSRLTYPSIDGTIRSKNETKNKSKETLLAKEGKKERPKGSKNKNQESVELTKYLEWIQGQIKQSSFNDGAFGNYPAYIC